MGDDMVSPDIYKPQLPDMPNNPGELRNLLQSALKNQIVNGPNAYLGQRWANPTDLQAQSSAAMSNFLGYGSNSNVGNTMSPGNVNYGGSPSSWSPFPQQASPAGGATPSNLATPSGGGSISTTIHTPGTTPSSPSFTPGQGALPNYSPAGGGAGIQMPGIYNDLSQVLGGALQGSNQGNPLLNQAGQMTSQMMSGAGNPVTQDPIYQAAREKSANDLLYDTAGINRAANLQGSRYSSGLQRSQAEAVTKRSLEDSLAYQQATAQALENARNRELNAGSLGAQIGKDQFMMPYNAISSIAPTALGLGSNINQESMAGIGLANQMGLGTQQMAQSQADQAYQDWLKTQLGSSPVSQMAAQYATSYPFNAQNPTVVENPWMGFLGGLLGG